MLIGHLRVIIGSVFTLEINMFIILVIFPDSSVVKESICNAGDPSLIPIVRRSPGKGNGQPLQYSGLENSMDWVAKSRTRLSDFHFTSLHFLHIMFGPAVNLGNTERYKKRK